MSLLLVAMAATLMAVAAPATAATSVSAREVKGQLRLNCTALPAQQRQYAVERNYCPPVTAAETGGVGVQNTVWGECGSSSLYIYDPAEANGVARFDMALHSTVGTMVEVSWNVTWHNQRTGQVSTFGDGAWPWSSDWSNQVPIWTNWGTVSGGLSGSMVTIWGGWCTILLPTDIEYIL
ncbi:hypothetical protein [Allorhizocola rhizosphaerae]|uniref:hypothetical protein n=1 Tax=Allorhizocola rhizosphaerae TaxID=1872709 RepID=UPI000E3CAAE0|nr:hypothetical protein [Allorhizocola rhizosphaerae]